MPNIMLLSHFSTKTLCLEERSFITIAWIINLIFTCLLNALTTSPYMLSTSLLLSSSFLSVLVNSLCSSFLSSVLFVFIWTVLLLTTSLILLKISFFTQYWDNGTFFNLIDTSKIGWQLHKRNIAPSLSYSWVWPILI